MRRAARQINCLLAFGRMACLLLLTLACSSLPNQNRTQVIQPEGNVAHTAYDERDLPLRVTQGIGSPEAATVSFTYDLNGNVAERRDAEDHDEIDRPISVSDASGTIATFRWMGPGFRPVERLNQNGTGESYLDAGDTSLVGYDPIRRVVGLQHRFSGGTPFVDRQYGYDRASNRTHEERLDDAGLTDHYAYDSAHRIRQSLFDQDAPAAPDPRELTGRSYQLAGVGNRRQVVEETLTGGAVAVAYAVNQMNEYPAVGATARGHDDNGNLLHTGSQVLRYDYRNRLVEVEGASGWRPGPGL